MSRLISQRLYRGRSKPGTASAAYTRLMILAREKERLTADIRGLESRLHNARVRLAEIDQEMEFIHEKQQADAAPVPSPRSMATSPSVPKSKDPFKVPVEAVVTPKPGRKKS